MRMSDNQKENWRYLFGAIGAIAMLLISVWLKDYVESQKERNAKIDAIYIQAITSNLKDSLQSVNIARIDAHQTITDEKITQMMQSILQSQIQLASIKENYYLNQKNQ
jgi:uncharacterized protein YnzC (UPF0291/DUF896 family)